MIKELKNETDKVVGKAKEMTGKIIDNDELEFKGKVQSIKAGIKSKVEDMKDDVEDMKDNVEEMKDNVLEKANDLIDKGRESFRNKK